MPDPATDETIRPGKYVSLTYSIADLNGNVLEQTDLPVGYIHGGRTELIGGMDEALHGRGVGDQVEMELGPEDGFGPHDPNMTFTDALENVPDEFRHVGAEVQMQSDSGEVRTFYVTHIGPQSVTIDGNHPLAGKPLRVQVRIREVRDPTAAELGLDGIGSPIPGATLH